MHISLNGKRAIVSGSTAGIGLAIAIGLAEAGAEVVLNGRTQSRVDEALNAVRERLPQARIIGIAADLGTQEGAQKLFDQVPHTDILVNNLGIFEPKPFFEIEDEDWQRFFDVNVLSAVRLSRHYARGMAERKWGRVVFLSSESALQIPTEMFTVMFALGRTSGWVAHWLEQQVDPEMKIGRPRQLYTGEQKRDIVALGDRK